MVLAAHRNHPSHLDPLLAVLPAGQLCALARGEVNDAGGREKPGWRMRPLGREGRRDSLLSLRKRVMPCRPVPSFRWVGLCTHRSMTLPALGGATILASDGTRRAASAMLAVRCAPCVIESSVSISLCLRRRSVDVCVCWAFTGLAVIVKALGDDDVVHGGRDSPEHRLPVQDLLGERKEARLTQPSFLYEYGAAFDRRDRLSGNNLARRHVTRLLLPLDERGHAEVERVHHRVHQQV